MPESATDRIFHFGVFEATEATGELRKNGTRIKLNSQPFRVLMMLLERPSATVTREEMRRKLWGDDTFVDFDHGLNTAINKIREALSDSALQPRYVETVSGKGYRFIAPVTERAPLSKRAEELAVAAPADPALFESGRIMPAGTLLATADELPAAPPILVKILLLLIQAMYLAFYVGALANIPEIHDIFVDAKLLPAPVMMGLLITTAAVLIPVRLFLFAAIVFGIRQLPSKFASLLPVLLPSDILWSVSPFLLIHHVSTGLALAMSAPLVYMPFAQRSLILMYALRLSRTS